MQNITWGLKQAQLECLLTMTISPGSSSVPFLCFDFKFRSFTITVLLCLKRRVTSPTLPFSRPAMTCTVSPILTCILCSTGRLFGLHFFRSHLLSCSGKGILMTFNIRQKKHQQILALLLFFTYSHLNWAYLDHKSYLHIEHIQSVRAPHENNTVYFISNKRDTN